MKAFLVAAAFAPAFVSAASASGVELTSDQTAVIKTSIVKQLRDPDSAKFSDMTAESQDTGETVVCGTVNAKNGFGGYVGAMPFSGKLYADGKFYLTKIADSPAGDHNLRALCKGLGAPISD